MLLALAVLLLAEPPWPLLAEDEPLPVDPELELLAPALVPVPFWPSAVAVRAESKMLPNGGPLL